MANSETVSELNRVSVVDRQALGVGQAMTVQEMIARVSLIDAVKKAVMQDGVHYGVIPGTDKPTLLLPGAEKLLLAFRLSSSQVTEITQLEHAHREYKVTTTVFAPDGSVVASESGVCSTMESKYRWRKATRKCPKCQQETIIAGKKEYGGGWLCWQKRGGCGAKFNEGDPEIISQQTGRQENEDLADVYNTVLRMAAKRSKVAATKSATGCSDFFTIDMEETVPEEVAAEPAQQRAGSQAETKQPLMRSWIGLTQAEWRAQSDKDKEARGSITTELAGNLLDVARAKGMGGEESILRRMREQYPEDMAKWGIKHLWQLPRGIAMEAFEQMAAM